MKKLYPVKMTKYNLEFLLSACDWLEDKQLKYMIQTKILSRLVALGFWGYSKRPITHKLPK